MQKTEGAIKNGQSEETGTIGHKTQNEVKNKKNPTQHRKLKRGVTRTPPKSGVTKERAVKNGQSRDTGTIGH